MRDETLRRLGLVATALLVPGGSLIAAAILAQRWREKRAAGDDGAS